MCGIVGFTGQQTDKKSILNHMMDTIAHRGPDGSGSFLDDTVALGHRRLAIIDLEGGTQPMFNENENLVVVFNGEIYNFQALQAELEAKGHQFATRSDTEVLLHGYEEWGKTLLQRLRGMFAFAIWDRTAQTLFCARDHFGIKPFYYYQNGDTLLFSSEIKGFLPHPEFQKQLNQEQLELYLSYQYSPGENTFFQGVKKLMPAHWLEWKHGYVTIRRYWSPSFQPKQKPLEYWATEIERAMQESVAAHKIADVEMAASLSSGIDSSYITYLSQVGKTFTASYADQQYSEAEDAKEMSDFIHAEHHLASITEERYWENISKIQYYMDEPLADASAPALYFVDQEAAKHVKVLLSGEGADELFGGYNIYKEPFMTHRYDRIPLIIRRAIGAVAQLFPPVHGINFLVRHSKPLSERYIGTTSLMTERQKQRILKTYTGKVKPCDISHPFFIAAEGQDAATCMQTTDLQLWMVGDILLKADKMSMANSLELRVPFVDREVFELARQIPTDCRVNNQRTKIALREAARRCIPQKTAEKKKLGFPVPIRAWLREEQYMQIVRTKLTSDIAAMFFDTNALDKMCLQHLSGKRDNWREIWCVFTFLIWYDEYFVKRS